jgi:hypothetical protein
MERALNIALYARRFRLLAERGEYMREDSDDRYAAVTERRSCGPLNPLDAAQIAVSDDVDRTCGYAVRVLSGAQGTPRGMRVLLDVLGMLDRDRVCGMYYALPPEKRRVADSDYVWAYYVREVERDMPGALAQVEESRRPLRAGRLGRRARAGQVRLSPRALQRPQHRGSGSAGNQACAGARPDATAVASDDPEAVLRAHFEERAP